MPPCVVTDIMNNMDGFDNDVVETALKEAACIAFGGIHVDAQSLLIAYLSSCA